MRQESVGIVNRGIFLFILICMGAGFGCATPAPETKKLTKTERARLLVEIANGALVEGDPTGALQSLSSAEQEDGRLPELHHSKALAYFQKHDLPQALLAARRAVELKPDYSEANNTLGKLLFEAGKYTEAVPYLKAAANDALNRETFKAWTNLGILKYRLEEYAEAEGFLKHAVQDAPLRACIAFNFLGHIKLKEKNLDEAIHNYEQATRKLCAGYGDAQLSLAQAYEQNKQYQFARKAYLEVQKQYPNTKLAEQAVDHLRYLP